MTWVQLFCYERDHKVNKRLISAVFLGLVLNDCVSTQLDEASAPCNGQVFL